MSSDRPWLDSLRESSVALQGVLGALLEAERHLPAGLAARAAATDHDQPEWAWLQLCTG